MLHGIRPEYTGEHDARHNPEDWFCGSLCLFDMNYPFQDPGLEPEGTRGSGRRDRKASRELEGQHSRCPVAEVRIS